jgi:hypothetical protein
MPDELDNITAARDAQAAYDAIPVISYDEMMTVIRRWLIVSDPGAIKLLLAVVFANQLPGDPVWLYLIAASSGGKTELLNGLSKVPTTYHLSQLTSNTLLSGYKKKDKQASLLLELGTGKTMLFKDFTSLLDSNRDELKEIMGQLREVFDGHATKRTGTGDEITWEGKMGFIAGCTPIIEQRMAIIGAMGERFLSYRMQQPDRKVLRQKMRDNLGMDRQMRSEIQDAMAGYLKGLTCPQELPVIPEDVNTMIDSLTDFIAASRAVVIRGSDNKKEIEYIAQPEMAGRTFKQLSMVAIAFLIMNGGTWSDDDSQILRNIAISSIHSIRYRILRILMQYSTQVKTATVAMELGYPTTTTRRYLEDLAAINMDDGRLRILRREYQGVGRPDLWELTPVFRDILVSMGEVIAPTKVDSGFLDEEKDIPAGVEHMGPTEDEMEEYNTEHPKPPPVHIDVQKQEFTL